MRSRLRDSTYDPLGEHIALMSGFGAVMPFGISRANLRRRSDIGVKSQNDQRRGAPLRAEKILTVPPAPAAQPCHGGARHRRSIISRTGNNSNRHLSRNPAPFPPTVELRQIVRTHEPHKASPRITALQFTKRIKSIACTKLSLDRRHPDRSATRGLAGRSKTGR